MILKAYLVRELANNVYQANTNNRNAITRISWNELKSHTVEACIGGSLLTSKGFADFDDCRNVGMGYKETEIQMQWEQKVYTSNFLEENQLIIFKRLSWENTTAVLYCMANPRARGGPVCHPGTGAGKDEKFIANISCNQFSFK